MAKYLCLFSIAISLFLGGLLRAEPVIVFNDNGAWCWYQDERVIIQDDKLIIGSVADVAGTGGRARDGHIEVVEYDLAAGGPPVWTVLHPHLQADDHNTAAFLPLPDGRILAMYAKHHADRQIRYRVTEKPNDTIRWSNEDVILADARVTYANVYRLTAENDGSGRIYNFYRGENFNPNFITSDDNGQTWSDSSLLLRKDGQRPYPRYTSNGVDAIHLITTEGHPRDFDNSIYYACLRAGKLYAADGTLLHDLADGPAAPENLEKIYTGSKDNVAWTTDIRLDADGRPYAAFSIQENQDMHDLHYGYARWDGSRWHVHEMAHAGTALYPAEADYTGLAALHPQDPNTIYLSADAHPLTGAPLVSAADGKRHYELFCGTTDDLGATWQWRPVTENSTDDNIRPIVRAWNGGTVLLWLRGAYKSYTDYDTDVVGLINPD